jgi:hypothetical protein
MRLLLFLFIFLPAVPACSGQGSEQESTPEAASTADVTAVEVTGAPNEYSFEVTVRSPDTGCEQYADWWEVVSPEGALLSRRILLHPHVDEQPFTRTGGPVDVSADSTVLVRAHMNTAGYGGQALRGTPADGFSPTDPPMGFASDLEDAPPQPDGCGL